MSWVKAALTHLHLLQGELNYVHDIRAPFPGGYVSLHLPETEHNHLTWTTTNIACTMG